MSLENTYRVRIGGEVVAAAGPQAVRRVPIETDDGGRRLLEFTRTWLELDELPGPVRDDTRLEIEHRPSGEAWQLLDRSQPAPAEDEEKTDEAGDTDVEAAISLLTDASYGQLQQVAKALGLKAQGTKDELRDAAAALFESPETPAEARHAAHGILEAERGVGLYAKDEKP